MNMKKYMTFTVPWHKFIENTEDTNMASWEEPVDIKCFIYGKNIFIREEERETSVSAKVYLTLEEVHVGDKLDNQVVKSVNMFPESWNQKNPLYECLIWNSGSTGGGT